jgi:hypothetical protein
MRPHAASQALCMLGCLRRVADWYAVLQGAHEHQNCARGAVCVLCVRYLCACCASGTTRMVLACSAHCVEPTSPLACHRPPRPARPRPLLSHPWVLSAERGRWGVAAPPRQHPGLPPSHAMYRCPAVHMQFKAPEQQRAVLLTC